MNYPRIKLKKKKHDFTLGYVHHFLHTYIHVWLVGWLFGFFWGGGLLFGLGFGLVCFNKSIKVLKYSTKALTGLFYTHPLSNKAKGRPCCASGSTTSVLKTQEISHQLPQCWMETLEITARSSNTWRLLWDVLPTSCVPSLLWGGLFICSQFTVSLDATFARCAEVRW